MLCFSNPRVAAPTTNARRNEFPRRPYCRQLGFREYLMVETKCTGIPYTGSPVSGKAQNRQLSLRESHTPEAEFPGITLLRLSEKWFEQRSDRGFGRYTESKMGRKVPSR